MVDLDEIQRMLNKIEYLKTNSKHLEFDLEKTRIWAITADKELDESKKQVAALKQELVLLKNEMIQLRKQNESLIEIVNPM